MNGPRLRRALQLKQLVERVRVSELADAERALREATRKLSDAVAEHDRRVADLQEQTVLSAVELSERARYVAQANQGVRETDKIRLEHLVQAEQRQADAHHATRDVRTMERLHERHRAESREQHRRMEQQLLDEHGQRKREDP